MFVGFFTIYESRSRQFLVSYEVYILYHTIQTRVKIKHSFLSPNQKYDLLIHAVCMHNMFDACVHIHICVGQMQK